MVHLNVVTMANLCVFYHNLKQNDASDKQESQLHRVAECTKLQGNLTQNTTELSSAECSAPRGGICRHGGQTGDRRLKAVVPVSQTLCEGHLSVE